VRGGYVFLDGVEDARTGFEPSYYTQLAQVERDHFWFQTRTRLVLWALDRYFPGARTYLELGCGTGQLLGEVRAARPRLDLTGTEVFEEGLRHAEARVPGATLLQMDARRIRFERAFDVIGAYDVLEHIEEDTGVLRAMYRALTPGGGIILTVPQHPFLWGPGDEYARHRRRYRRRELAGKVMAAGFRVIHVTSFVSVLFPALLLSRLLARRRAASYDPLREFRIPAPANRALGWISAAERGLVRLGLPLPFGGSMLLVARRP
jgi:SAM-dependent methyltransferase